MKFPASIAFGSGSGMVILVVPVVRGSDALGGTSTLAKPEFGDDLIGSRKKPCRVAARFALPLRRPFRDDGEDGRQPLRRNALVPVDHRYRNLRAAAPCRSVLRRVPLKAAPIRGMRGADGRDGFAQGVVPADPSWSRPSPEPTGPAAGEIFTAFQVHGKTSSRHERHALHAVASSAARHLELGDAVLSLTAMSAYSSPCPGRQAAADCSRTIRTLREMRRCGLRNGFRERPAESLLPANPPAVE